MMVTNNVTKSQNFIQRLFNQRTIVVASMHHKERVMAPLINRFLPVRNVVVAQIDTDKFGTFSGEIEREFDPITTLRSKICEGLNAAGETLGIGNEGSFGPHPQVPFIQANQEIVMLVDRKNNLEIVENYISTNTNHNQAVISSFDNLIHFADGALFPSHGIIIKQQRDNGQSHIIKGIQSYEQLRASFNAFENEGCTIIAETDMRAHMNPTRMKNIETATELLMKKVINACPNCEWPGFGVVMTRTGLPCRLCNSPTKLILSKIYSCKSCDYTDERFYTDGEKADPQYCDQCNP